MALVPLYPVTDHPLLSEKFAGLKVPGAQAAQNVLAELLLGLSPPPYVDAEAEQLTMAVVLQINYQLERAITPDVLKSMSNTHPGNTTAYRDRYISPGAWAIVERVTGVRYVGFTVPGRGV